jgi:hypothetical protein
MASVVQPVLRLKADLKCLVCGHVAAEVEGEYGRPIKLTRIDPIGQPRLEVRQGEPLRCPRCEGRLHLDEIETLRNPALRISQAARRGELRRAS